MVFTTLLLDIWVLAGKNYSGLKIRRPVLNAPGCPQKTVSMQRSDIFFDIALPVDHFVLNQSG